MKNLMLGLAVATLCGSAVVAEAAGTVISSTKTVGYRNTACKTLTGESAYTLATPTFVNTDGKSDLSISSITVTGTGTVQLKTFGADGAFGDVYTWQAASVDNGNTAGWYKGQDLCTATFKKGEGFVVLTEKDSNAKIRIAGLVPSGSVSYTLSAGFNLIGNPFNTGVQIQKFKLTGVNTFDANLQEIGAAGQTGDVLLWVAEKEAGSAAAAGWYYQSGTRVENDTNEVSPGTTYLLYCANGGTLTIGD